MKDKRQHHRPMSTEDLIRVRNDTVDELVRSAEAEGSIREDELAKFLWSKIAEWLKRHRVV